MQIVYLQVKRRELEESEYVGENGSGGDYHIY